MIQTNLVGRQCTLGDWAPTEHDAIAKVGTFEIVSVHVNGSQTDTVLTLAVVHVGNDAPHVAHGGLHVVPRAAVRLK